MATATETLRIGLADNGRTMTLQEFLDAEEEEGYRYELARGVLEVSYVPGEPHGLIVYLLYKLLTRYDDGHPGMIHRFGGAAEFRLWLPEMVSGRNPDLAVVFRNTPPDDSGMRPPSLVVEVLSGGNEARTRDYVTKRQEYLAFGLREYWIVDRFEKKVTVLRRHGDTWAESAYREGQEASGHVLPGFVVPVAELWAALAGVPDDETPDA